MPNSNLPFSQKSIHRLATEGITDTTLANELGDLETELEVLHAQGLEIVERNNRYFFQTSFQKIEDAIFCIVDIETNGSKLEKHQIIEIAALKVQNGAIIDKFETFVYCESINPAITEITGIKAEDTSCAPQLKETMYKFREFLAESVFVAHDVRFDYRFISGSMEKVGLPPLANRALCSIDLAERTIVSYRYGLRYLNEYLNLYPEATHHRAMSDVIATTRLFLKSLENLPKEINTVEELIRFSKNGKRLKRPKFDPLAKEQEES
jgi:DNA polymerase-3 subunit epsilon